MENERRGRSRAALQSAKEVSIPQYGSFPVGDSNLSTSASRAGAKGSSASATEQLPSRPSKSPPQFLNINPDSPDTPLWRKILFVFFDGYQTFDHIDASQLWKLPEKHSSAAVADKFFSVFHASGSLRSAIWRFQARRFMKSAVLAVCSLVCSLMMPFALYDLLSFVSAHGYTDMIRVYLDLALLYLLPQLDSIFERHSRYKSFQADMDVESALRTLLFEQTLRSVPDGSGISQQRAHRLAEVAQLYADVEFEIGSMIIGLVRLWHCLLQVFGDLFIIVHVISIPLLDLVIGLSIICVAVVTSSVLDLRARKKWSLQNAERLHTVHTCFKSIQMVKLNAWETKMEERIAKARVAEDDKRWKLVVIRALQRSLYFDAPQLASIIIFAWMEYESDVWSPASVFSMLLLLRRMMDSVSGTLLWSAFMMRGSVALQKLETFVKRYPCCTDSQTDSQSSKPPRTHTSDATKHDIVVECARACIASSGNPTKALLVNVNLHIRRGELVVICGQAGAGKTTLLTALSGNATCVYGEIYRSKGTRMSFCSQEPWLQTTSIRDNILFGEEFSADKYWCIIDACGLIEDMKVLPDGDLTRVGPKGINLSGGQKSRIALARACYSNADVMLMDCPFASVDAVVQSDVFSKCILELLRFKTVVIVTHNPEIISCPLVDQVIEVTGMTVVTKSKRERDGIRGEGLSRRVLDSIEIPPWKKSINAADVAVAREQTGLNLYAVAAESGTADGEHDQEAKALSSPPPESVDPAYYTVEAAQMFFFQWDSLKLLIFAMLALIVYGVLSVAKDLWLIVWSGSLASGAGQTNSDVYELTHDAVIYGGLILGSVVASIDAAVLVVWAMFESATRMFSHMTSSLLRAPISFFYTMPIGDIFNRYMADMEVLDVHMVRPIFMIFRSVMALVSCIVMVWYYMGVWGSIIVLIVYFVIKGTLTIGLYVRLMQIQTTAHAKLLNFMSESLDGISVIRGFGSAQIDRFLEVHGELSDQVIRSLVTLEAFNNFVLIRLNYLYGVLLLLLAFVLSVTAPDGAISPNVLGLLICYIFSIYANVISFGNVVVDTLLSMINIQRVREFCILPPESEIHTVVPILLPPKWPTRGSLVFDHVWFQYANDTPDLKMPLRDVSFQINGGEKIGIIGRTGSGKSSIAMALFRMHSLSRGRILVDDVDVCRLALSELRSKICVIPQTPLFYRCSVRDYLDPFGEFEDARLWSELTKCGLRDTVHSLDDELWDNGENWSLGERQMLGLSRALLRPSRILILDESFTALDQTSETRLMQVLDTDFRDATVLLITHRLDLVLKFDRIMVMRSGELVEFGDVEELASNPSSAFYDFLETTLLTC